MTRNARNRSHEVADLFRGRRQQPHLLGCRIHVTAYAQQRLRGPFNGFPARGGGTIDLVRIGGRDGGGLQRGVGRAPCVLTAQHTFTRPFALMHELIAECGRTRRHVAGTALHHTRRSVHLGGNCRQLIGLALEGVDQQGEFIEHAIEAHLEKPELVGMSRIGARLQVTPLHLCHAFPRTADARDQLYRHLDHLLRHHYQHHRREQHLRPWRGVGGARLRVGIARDQKADRR